MRICTCAALAACVAAPVAAQSTSGRATTMPTERVLRALSRAIPDSTRTVAAFPFDGTERSNWFYIPFDRHGLTLARMSPEARALVDTLLLTGLSPSGFATAKNIMRHEAILHDIEAAGPPSGQRNVRDSSKYYLSLFGAPDESDVWGWRVEGHHLSVNFTGIGGTTQVVSPLFMGANPARVPSGPKAGLRILAAEEDVARALVLMLDERRRRVAIFTDTAFVEVETRNDPKARALSMEGLRAADMSEPERAQLRALIEVYAGRMSAAARTHAMRDIDEGGFGELRFAWAGGTAVGQAHYYRIHGPTILIEYDNQQTNANHIHTVWRDLRHDFGGDLLADHYRTHKHPYQHAAP
ncbi:MAG: DUF3500 domain-containing protein [bacterium]